MINASGGGALFGFGCTGCTRLTDTVVVVVVVPFVVARVDDAAGVVEIVTPPRLVPSGKPFVFATTVSMSPLPGMIPVDGVTVSHGSLTVATNDWPPSAGSSWIV